MLRDRFNGGASFLALRQAPDNPGGGDDGDNGGNQNGGGDDGGQGDDQGAQGGADGQQGGQDGGQQQAAGGQDGAQDGGQGGGDQGAQSGAGGQQDATWKDRELARRQRRMREEAEARATAERENADLRRMLEQLSSGGDQGQNGGNGQPRTYTQEELNREAARLAAARLEEARTNDQVQAFNRACNNAVISGRGAYGQQQYDTAMTQLNALGFYGDDGKDLASLNLALETDDPAGVMFHLANNPDDFYRVMELPPMRRHAEFVRIADRTRAARAAGGGGGAQRDAAGNGGGQRRPSGAPPPIAPIGGGGGESDVRYSENVSAADWHANEARREKEYWDQKNRELRG